AAVETLHPTEQHRQPDATATDSRTPPVADAATAISWLETELPNLVAISGPTARDWPGHTIRLASTLFRYLDCSGHYAEALTIHTQAREAADRCGDRAAKAHALTNLGTVFWRQGRYQQAVDHYRQAIELFREIGDQAGEARALGNLSFVH